ncbi:MAG: mechanosensitive ion channel [Opitutaceae bacterium]|nr:mechanosensitive ion channel [Opitutaceae bacterium]
MSATHPVSLRRGWPLWLCLLFCVYTLNAAPDDERIERLQEDLKTLETVVTGTSNASEKGRLQLKLERMNQELRVLQERQELERRRLALLDQQPSKPIDRLRERIRAIDVTVEDMERRIQEIITLRRAAVTERDVAEARLTAAKAATGTKETDTAELNEQLVNRNEMLRSLALQREAAEARLELAREGDRLREFVKNVDVTTRPNLKLMFDAYTKAREMEKSEDKLNLLATAVGNNLQIARETFDLAQLKLAKFDEELVLLEKQTGFFRTDPAVAKLLVAQKAQKRMLAERIPIYQAQVEALRSADGAVAARQELASIEKEAVLQHFEDLKSGYVQRLKWPTVAMSGLLLVYGLLHYLLLPLAYRKEGLFLARRLGRYACLLLAVCVFAGFLFDDLSMVAATLGIVSAALVIALQDVCTSIAGWFVIMTGSKFKIGDRLEIEDSQGDVIDIQLLRTTLVEVANWMDQDHPTGRVLVIPNNFIFKSKVFNYSHQHPFIWGKLEIMVTYSTPIAEATALFHRVLAEEMIEEFAAAQQAADVFRKRYGVDDAVYQPRVNTRLADSGVYLDLVYVAHYRRSTAARNRIVRRVITELEKNPRIQLAYPTAVEIAAAPAPDAPSAIMGTEPDTGSRPPFGYPTAQFPLRPPVLPGR